MKMKRVVTFLLLFITFTAQAQQRWNLRTVVDYAMANNITVKLSEVQTRLSALTYKQSRLSRIPNLDLTNNLGFNSGNNQDPTTFQRVTQTYISAGFQLQSSADIFNFFSKQNIIAANKWELEASFANVDKLKNDIALTAANGYLQVLLAKEQQNITTIQVQQTAAQLANTRKIVDAGALPELNASQLEAQLALDSVNYITAKGNLSQAILLLKSYMNIDAAAPFEVDAPPVESIPVEAIADLQPENVYLLAMANQPLQRYNELRLKAAEKNRLATKAQMLPSLTAYGTIGSNYIKARTPAYFPVPGSFNQTGLFVNVSGVPYSVVSPALAQNGYNKSAPFNKQFSDNLRQSAGLSLNVPILNGYNRRGNYERSLLNISSLQLQKLQDDQKLKQDIYQAYTSAMIALEKFNASKRTVSINETTYNYATKRFDVGILSTFDLITTKNNLLRAKLEYTINRFDYVFKMKVLEFYKGLGLKL